MPEYVIPSGFGTVPEEEPEQIRCSYEGGHCLRRDRDGMVPARDDLGRETTQHCARCDQHFCTQHNHLSPRAAEFRCAIGGERVPRCVVTERCEPCGMRMCPDHMHEPDSLTCLTYQGNEPDPEEEEYEQFTSYRGPYREAELLFNGDTPVPGLAEGERYAAVEMEEELTGGGSGTFSLPRRFGITTDGSLRNGVEVTLPPSRMDALVQNVNLAVDALQSGGYEAQGSCGLHAHIDLRDKVNDPRFLSKLFAAFYAVEDVLFAMQRANRAENHYCRPIRHGWRFYDTFGKKAPDFEFTYYKQSKSIANKLQIDGQKRYKSGPRYNAFNFHSVYYRGSLEVRLNEGSLDARTILLWIELLQKIIARTEKGITWATLRKLVSMDVGNAKIKYMKRVFKLGDVLDTYVRSRIVSAQGALVFRLPFTMGTAERGRPSSLIPTRVFRATHRRCRWCSAVVSLARRCSYCRREARFTEDEYGGPDQRGMYFGSGASRQFMVEDEYRRLSAEYAQPVRS